LIQINWPQVGSRNDRAITGLDRSTGQTPLTQADLRPRSYWMSPSFADAIALSRTARLGAVQQRPFRTLPVAERNDEPGCTGMAEIVVEGGPLTLQLSGVETPSIMVAVFRLPD
jgi:hypothetical protein